MKNEINAVLENMTATTPEPEDYTGEDGLLYCGKCRKPKEAYFAPDKAAIFGRDRHPAECDCQRAAREEREAAEKRRRHLDTVEELKRRGFTDPTMRDWTFENDNGRNPQAGIARRYVEHDDIHKVWDIVFAVDKYSEWRSDLSKTEIINTAQGTKMFYDTGSSSMDYSNRMTSLCGICFPGDVVP